MGCGTSRLSTPVAADEDAPDNPTTEGPQTLQLAENSEELNSDHSTSPDRNSRPVEPPNPSSSPPHLESNGTEVPTLTAPSSPPEEEEEVPGEPPGDILVQSLSAGGGRAVAFEVATPEEQGDSLIKRHPPRKFQKLEDQQQNTSLTQEILEEKQAIAEKRRQEILTQRVQSAKTRTARSAGGRLRARGSEADEVDQFEDGDIEGGAADSPDNEM